MRMRARAALGLTTLAIVAAGILVLVAAPDAWAQPSPFGVGRPQAAPPPPIGVTGWVIAKQAEFYRQFSGLIRAANRDRRILAGEIEDTLHAQQVFAAGTPQLPEPGRYHHPIERTLEGEAEGADGVVVGR
jgi:hypothetical protein